MMHAYIYTFYELRTFGDSVAAPTLWNSPPGELRNAESLDIFKRLLKHHLFTKAFGFC